MAERRDKLGRRIPVYDRSAANKRGNATKKEKYGTDYHARIGADGGRHRGRGYFGQLKDEGKTEELKNLAQQAVKARKAKAPVARTKRRKNSNVGGQS